MAGGQKFCLRWDGFRSRLSSVFDELRKDEELLDVTLCCDGGRTVKAHRILLSASSPSLRQLLKEHPCQHPVFFLKDTSAEDLSAVIEFIYNGEVKVTQAQLASFIKTAEMLQIRGLGGTESDTEGEQTPPSAARRQSRPSAVTPPPPPPPPRPVTAEVISWSGPADPAPAAGRLGPPPVKRRRRRCSDGVSDGGGGSAAAEQQPADAGGCGGQQVIKTEEVDVSDDEGATLEDALVRLSGASSLVSSAPCLPTSEAHGHTTVEPSAVVGAADGGLAALQDLKQDVCDHHSYMREVDSAEFINMMRMKLFGRRHHRSDDTESPSSQQRPRRRSAAGALLLMDSNVHPPASSDDGDEDSG